MHLPGQPLRTRGTAGAARTEILVTASRARQPSATALSDLASRRSSLDAQVILDASNTRCAPGGTDSRLVFGPGVHAAG